jgi:hypothetical protein
LEFCRALKKIPSFLSQKLIFYLSRKIILPKRPSLITKAKKFSLNFNTFFLVLSVLFFYRVGLAFLQSICVATQRALYTKTLSSHQFLLSTSFFRKSFFSAAQGCIGREMVRVHALLAAKTPKQLPQKGAKLSVSRYI